MFILEMHSNNSRSNHPKYLVLYDTQPESYISSCGFYTSLSYTYYIVGYYIELCNLKSRYIPTFVVTIDLHIDLLNVNNGKFNLNKLGTNYITNTINSHYRNECKGNYPLNYVFVEKPDWPEQRNEKLISLTNVKNITRG